MLGLVMIDNSANRLPGYKNRRPLRVLFVGISFIIKLYQAKLTAMINTQRVEAALVCPAKWKFKEWSREFHLKSSSPKIQIFPSTLRFFTGRAGAYLYSPLTLLHALSKFKPDILYVEQESFSISAFEMAVFARVFNVPLALFVWENMDRQLSLPRRWTRSYVLHVAHLITAGNQGAATILRTWGYKGKINVLPQLGVDTDIFAPRSNPSSERPFSIGFVGRFVYEKGVDLILTAAKYLLDQGLMCRVVLCGTGPHLPDLQKHAGDLEINHHVVWLGEFQYEDVPDAISQMDVLVLPSRSRPNVWEEQFGHVLIEAMAMGVPAIGSSSGAIPEVLGRLDLIFSENDTRELAGLLERLMIDEKFYAAAVQYGHQRVSHFYTHEAIAEKLIADFEEVLEPHFMDGTQ